MVLSDLILYQLFPPRAVLRDRLVIMYTHTRAAIDGELSLVRLKCCLLRVQRSHHAKECVHRHLIDVKEKETDVKLTWRTRQIKDTRPQYQIQIT